MTILAMEREGGEHAVTLLQEAGLYCKLHHTCYGEGGREGEEHAVTLLQEAGL